MAARRQMTYGEPLAKLKLVSSGINMNVRPRCTTMGHSWVHSDKPIYNELGMVGMFSQCSFCLTERTKWIARSGDTKVSYHHQEGYLQHGEDKLSQKELRAAYVVQLMKPMNQRKKK